MLKVFMHTCDYGKHSNMVATSIIVIYPIYTMNVRKYYGMVLRCTYRITAIAINGAK